LNWYSRVLFPLGCDAVLSSPRFHGLRRDLLSEVRGEVLEIGFGTGLNLPHYPDHVSHITAVDVNPGMHRRAARRVAESPIAVEHHTVDGTSLPMEDESFDTAVSSWTLCSIGDVGRALREIHRVLRPGGRFLFLEHGLADDVRVQRWQRRLNPIQRIVADGCNLDRDIRHLIEEEGFRITSLREYYLDRAPKILGYTYHGTATK